jgi:hypothetical protein
MTAVQPGNSVTGPLRSLEVRWILPGPLEPAVTGWFARFPAEVSSREDTYLVDPQLGGQSVKLRGGKMLEVKVYRGSPGILKVAGRACGRLESWDKWSFAGEPASGSGADLPGWRPVHKLISRFSAASRHGQARVRGLGEEPGCHVELTEVHMKGQVWWTLGFEAIGPASLLRGELDATAAFVFAQALPGGMELGTDDCRSYAQWLIVTGASGILAWLGGAKVPTAVIADASAFAGTLALCLLIAGYLVGGR